MQGLQLQHKYSSWAAGKEVAGTWADIWSTKQCARQRGASGSTKCHFTYAAHTPEVSTLNFKWHRSLCDEAEKTIAIPRVAWEILYNFLPLSDMVPICSSLLLENIKILISIPTPPGPLLHSIVNNLASILLFQGSIGLEVCERVFTEGRLMF